VGSQKGFKVKNSFVLHEKLFQKGGLSRKQGNKCNNVTKRIKHKRKQDHKNQNKKHPNNL